jgi:MoxR-like ATPase
MAAAQRRTPPDLYKVINEKFFGIESKINPLTDKELKEAGAFAHPIKHYVQDHKRKYSWQQYAALCILKTKRHLYIQGESSTGKDSLVEQIASVFRIPFKAFSFKEGINANAWVTRTELKNIDGKVQSVVSEGELAKAVRGFKSSTGEVFPYIILLSDFDRARPADLEILRNALQIGNAAYLIDPVKGSMIPVLEGTVFVATGNSGIDGDPSGMMIYHQIDASIMNRFLKVRAELPSEEFEKRIIQSEYPTLQNDDATLVVQCLNAIRSGIKTFNFPLEFGLRDASNWTRVALDLVELELAKSFKEGLKHAFNVVVSGAFKDPSNAEALYGALDLFLDLDEKNNEVVEPKSTSKSKKKP